MSPGAAAGIRAARADEVRRLGEVEQRASERFAGLIAKEVAESCVDPAELLLGIREGRVLVATDPRDLAIGFAYLVEVEGEAHLEELDVVPEHGKKGLGTLLLEAACAWARGRGHRALSLSTYRDIPFNNAPFYLRHGFREVSPADFSPAHPAVFARELRKGYDMPRRVLLSRSLA